MGLELSGVILAQFAQSSCAKNSVHNSLLLTVVATSSNLSNAAVGYSDFLSTKKLSFDSLSFCSPRLKEFKEDD